MQVSWIDSDHLNDLLRQLQDPAPPQAAPDALFEEAEVPAPPPPVALRTTFEDDGGKEPEESGAPLPDIRTAPEVARIRDRLREVRERAEAAGLLKKTEPSTPSPFQEAAPPEAEREPEPEPENSVEEETVIEGTETAIAEAEAPATASKTAAAADEATAPAPATESTGTEPASAFVPGVEAPESASAPALGTPDDAALYFEVPLGSALERLDAFATWARQRVAPGELLLLDEHGDLLWGAEAKAALVFSVMLAAGAVSRSSAADVCEDGVRVARQPTVEGGELAVLSCPTRLGLIHLAVEHPSRLPDNEAALLRQALMSAIEVQ